MLTASTLIVLGAVQASPPTSAPTRDCLAQFATPAAFNKPARDLTLDEARDIVVALIRDRAVTLHDRSVRFDTSCKVVSPRPTDRVDIAESIAGVTLVYGPVDRPRAYPTLRLDLRHVVALTRLAAHLKTRWDATAIRHLGISAGKGGNNAHNSGRAIDLASVIGKRDGVSYTVDVWRDWGRKPRLSRKARAGANHPRYRLTPKETAKTAPSAYDLFLDIYAFATREYSDSSTKPGRNGDATEIGTTSYVLHPDHPHRRLAWAHRDHFHLQIGPARGEGKRPRSRAP